MEFRLDLLSMKVNPLVDLKQEICWDEYYVPVTRRRDKTVIHITSEYRKLVQNEYKTNHNWEGKVIHRKLCKRLKFDQIVFAQTKIRLWEWDSKILRDFEIQTDHLMSAWRPDIVLIKKKKRT